MKRKVWLTGSRKYIERVIHKEKSRCTVTWYGKEIEVKESESGNWYTVEAY